MSNNRTYEEYNPTAEWSRSTDADAVKISLPGFKREDLRVLVDNHGHLRTRGERHVTGNKWSRFQNDFELPANCNADGIRAKFENETLTITLPKKTPSTPMQPPPRRPTAPAPPLQGQGLPPAARPAAPAPVPAAPLAPAAPSVKPPAESRASMPTGKTHMYDPLPVPEVDQPPATTKPPQHSLGAVQRPKEEEEEKQRKREEEGKMAEDRKEMVQEKDTQQQQPMLAETALAKPGQASASHGLLVSVAVAVVVLLGFTVYVWHSLRNATGGAGEHGHGHLGAGSFGDEM